MYILFFAAKFAEEAVLYCDNSPVSCGCDSADRRTVVETLTTGIDQAFVFTRVLTVTVH